MPKWQHCAFGKKIEIEHVVKKNIDKNAGKRRN